MFGVFAQLLNNKPLTIVGNGKQPEILLMLQMLYIFYASRSKIYHDIFNVGTSKPTSVNYIVKKSYGQKNTYS